MLPAPTHRGKNRMPGQNEENVQPGTWWRLTNGDHDFAEREAPEHGLILMVQEVRMVDGEMHTIVLHSHPLWSRSDNRYENRLLVEDFLTSFAPEPEGDMLRELEINTLMNRISSLSVEISMPPEEQFLLEARTAVEAKEAQPKDGASVPGDPYPASDRNIPAVLLPSQDVVEAQASIENRIAVVEARKNWIVAKTDELKSEMSLVSTYQTEKVGVALAGISQETAHAESLLKNVQTMRLFLGEDVSIQELRTGKGADPSLPLTFMQQLLYLDEEIFVHDASGGFDGDMMGDLAGILQKDMSFLERMLPYERSVCITRVRRNPRDIIIKPGASIKEIIGSIMQGMEDQEQDKLIQIFVRDGERVNMIIADEATSNAKRLFPSNEEIDALFKARGLNGPREITPTDIDYTDARSKHDTTALFYKRFLLILWGLHERTDIFGDFMPKGANWLEATTHSDYFRFVHDDEGTLLDGRPSIDSFISDMNDRMSHGSRCIVDWDQAANCDTAPAVRKYEDGLEVSTGRFVDDVSVVNVFFEKGHIKASGDVYKGKHSYWMSDENDRKSVKTKVSLSYPVGDTHRPGSQFKRTVSSGFLCIDHLTLSDLDYYIGSRRARRTYARWIRIFKHARELLIEEQSLFEEISADIVPQMATFQIEIMKRAMKLWRAGSKWGWPRTDNEKESVRKLFFSLQKTDGIENVAGMHKHVVSAGLRSNGDIFVICDDVDQPLPGAFMVPWMTEFNYAGPGSRKPKADRIVSLFDEMGATYEETFFGSVTREDIRSRLYVSSEENQVSKDGSLLKYWMTPTAFADVSSAKALDKIAGNGDAVDAFSDVLHGNNVDHLFDMLDEYRSKRKSESVPGTGGGRSVIEPLHHIDAGLVMGFNEFHIPEAWVVSAQFNVAKLATCLGHRDHVLDVFDRMYASPQKIMSRIEGNISREGYNPLSISLRKVSWSNPLASVFSPGMNITHSLMSRSLELADLEEVDLTWKERAAAQITKSTTRSWSRVWDADDLRKRAPDLHFVGPSGAEALLEHVFSFNQ